MKPVGFKHETPPFCYQGFAADDYSGKLAALNLGPYDFYNIGATSWANGPDGHKIYLDYIYFYVLI